MQIIHRQPDSDVDVSYAAIDVGFDVRALGIPCVLPASARRIGYDRDGESYILVGGSTAAILAELREAGYTIIPETATA
jgi:hypothetical protein